MSYVLAKINKFKLFVTSAFLILKLHDAKTVQMLRELTENDVFNSVYLFLL